MSFDAHGGIVFRLDAQLHLDKLRGAVSVSVICDFDPSFTPHLATNGAIRVHGHILTSAPVTRETKRTRRM